MKTSEDKLNEALREALKRKFDNFEEKPNPSSYSIIRAHIKQPRNYKYLFLTILFVGVFIAGIRLNQNWTTEKKITEALTARTDIAAASKPISEVATIKIAKLKILDQKTTQPAQFIRPQKITGTKFKRNLPQEVSKSEFKRNLPQEVSRKQFPPQEISKNEINRNLPREVSRKQSPQNLSEMESEQMKPVSMNMPEVTVFEVSQNQHAIHTNPQKISWLVNVAGLKTYQILTVPKSLGQNFQNFRFPSVFSLESAGYKFSAGAEKKGFQILLNYSTFRQRYSYEIAGNEYVVQEEGLASYKIVRPGTVVTENRKMDLLGIGVNKQIQWGRSFQKYYASAGLEYSHTLKSGPGIGWVNASLGKQFAVNRTMLLNIGPYAEFSPVKVSVADNPFLYQPYRVGISIGMKLIRP